MAQDNSAMVEANSMTVNNSGGIHVTSEAQAELGGCYGQTLEVELDTPKGPTTSLAFEADIHSGSGITIPAEIRRMANISPGDLVDARFGLPESDESEADTDDESEADTEDDSEADTDDAGLEELFEDLSPIEEDDEQEDEQEEGLGELFG